MSSSIFVASEIHEKLDRAIVMLNVAAKFALQHAPSETIYYDGARCDGNCVADDLTISAAELGDVIRDLKAGRY